MNSKIMDNDRAVSPVIGVILMVAITVILAAVIGTFVLDLGNNAVSQNPQAGVSYDQTTDGTVDSQTAYKVTITVNSMPRASSVTISASDADGSGTSPSVGTSPLSSVGSTSDITDLTEGDKIVVTAKYQGEEVVISTYTVK